MDVYITSWPVHRRWEQVEEHLTLRPSAAGNTALYIQQGSSVNECYASLVPRLWGWGGGVRDFSHSVTHVRSHVSMRGWTCCEIGFLLKQWTSTNEDRTDWRPGPRTEEFHHDATPSSTVSSAYALVPMCSSKYTSRRRSQSTAFHTCRLVSHLSSGSVCVHTWL